MVGLLIFLALEIPELWETVTSQIQTAHAPDHSSIVPGSSGRIPVRLASLIENTLCRCLKGWLLLDFCTRYAINPLSVSGSSIP